jgi:hypothetical protein
MRILFDPTTVQQGESGSVTGVVYFEFTPDLQFPVAGWNDFVVVVANWWRAALEQMSEGQAEAKFPFMDGPYWITAISRGTDLLLRCIKDRRGVGVVHEAVVQLDDLEREVITFARGVSVACKAAALAQRLPARDAMLAASHALSERTDLESRCDTGESRPPLTHHRCDDLRCRHRQRSAPQRDPAYPQRGR